MLNREFRKKHTILRKLMEVVETEIKQIDDQTAVEN